MLLLRLLKKEHIHSLIQWFEKNKRDFPWRKNPDPFWVWIAEIMSQQTQMTTLVPYFYRFIERFSCVQDLASASEQEVLSVWTGLGYYSRAKNLHKAAQKIVKQGDFPKTFEEWLALPGIGPYSAAAIVSQCFGVSEPVWDGNVARVCSRLVSFPKKYADLQSHFRKDCLNELRALMQGCNPSFFNQALMELGSQICTKQTPLCARCALKEVCMAYQQGVVDQFPPLKPRKNPVILKPRAYVMLRQKRYVREAFLIRRKKGLWFSGLWDFPSELGGNEQPIIKMKKQGSGVSLGIVKHNITHHKILLQGYVQIGSMHQASQHQGRWLELEDLLSQHPSVPLSTTARKVLRLVMGRFGEGH